jgi:hypothetical protein
MKQGACYQLLEKDIVLRSDCEIFCLAMSSHDTSNDEDKRQIDL